MENALALHIPISAINFLYTHHTSSQYPVRDSILQVQQGQLSVVLGQSWNILAPGEVCGTQKDYLDIFGGLGAAGLSQTWQKLHLCFVFNMDLSMPYVLVLTQISQDEEVLPLHKGGNQSWTNVYAAQDLE